MAMADGRVWGGYLMLYGPNGRPILRSNANLTAAYTSWAPVTGYFIHPDVPNRAGRPIVLEVGIHDSQFLPQIEHMFHAKTQWDIRSLVLVKTHGDAVHRILVGHGVSMWKSRGLRARNREEDPARADGRPSLSVLSLPWEKRPRTIHLSNPTDVYDVQFHLDRLAIVYDNPRLEK
jgi:hypothetical protein